MVIYANTIKKNLTLELKQSLSIQRQLAIWLIMKTAHKYQIYCHHIPCLDCNKKFVGEISDELKKQIIKIYIYICIQSLVISCIYE